ncbi:MAG: hypothetical protein V3R78_00360 [Thermodesulfobacteriota bacterium]
MKERERDKGSGVKKHRIDFLVEIRLLCGKLWRVMKKYTKMSDLHI